MKTKIFSVGSAVLASPLCSAVCWAHAEKRLASLLWLLSASPAPQSSQQLPLGCASGRTKTQGRLKRACTF